MVVRGATYSGDFIVAVVNSELVTAAEGTLAELRQQNGRNDTSLEDMFIALVDTNAAAA